VSEIVKAIFGFITGGSSGASAVGNAVTMAGVLAALAPFVLWFVGHKDETLIVVSYGDAAFWGAIIALQLVIANYSRRGAKD
jgi:hypothetical protein